MLFACCHRDLPIDAQRILALKILFGLTDAELADHLFTSEANVYKRLQRARAKLQSTGRNLDGLTHDDRRRRTPAVRSVLHLLFTEGYAAEHWGRAAQATVGLRRSPLWHRRLPADAATSIATAPTSPRGGLATLDSGEFGPGRRRSRDHFGARRGGRAHGPGASDGAPIQPCACRCGGAGLGAGWPTSSRTPSPTTRARVVPGGGGLVSPRLGDQHRGVLRRLRRRLARVLSLEPVLLRQRARRYPGGGVYGGAAPTPSPTSTPRRITNTCRWHSSWSGSKPPECPTICT